jgi:hypothetical protein
VTGMLLRGRPDAGPVRAAISAKADQVEDLRSLVELGRQVVLEQHDRRPVPAGKLSPDMPGLSWAILVRKSVWAVDGVKGLA